MPHGVRAKLVWRVKLVRRANLSGAAVAATA
jgi:hypothetical protein